MHVINPFIKRELNKLLKVSQNYVIETSEISLNRGIPKVELYVTKNGVSQRFLITITSVKYYHDFSYIELKTPHIPNSEFDMFAGALLKYNHKLINELYGFGANAGFLCPELNKALENIPNKSELFDYIQICYNNDKKAFTIYAERDDIGGIIIEVTEDNYKFISTNTEIIKPEQREELAFLVNAIKINFNNCAEQMNKWYLITRQ